MRKSEFKDYFEKNRLASSDYEATIELIQRLEDRILSPAETMSLGQLDDFIFDLYKHHRSDVKAFIALMRYFKLVKRHDLYIRLTQYTGGIDVIETILERLKKELGKDRLNLVMEFLKVPELGLRPEMVIEFTDAFMRSLHLHLSDEEIKTVLIGNNHQIPLTAFASEIVEYENSETLEAYLKGKHERQVATLQKHADENKVWFEQLITQEVVDYVKSDQELLSAVLVENKLMMRKIPYDIDGFLKASDPLKKRYLSCHCPFARESIMKQEVHISPLWCYCSAGFEKLPFEAVLKQPLKIKVLKNVLQGDDECSFEIPLDGIDYKK